MEFLITFSQQVPAIVWVIALALVGCWQVRSDDEAVLGFAVSSGSLPLTTWAMRWLWSMESWSIFGIFGFLLASIWLIVAIFLIVALSWHAAITKDD